MALDPALSKFFRAAGVFFLDGFIGGALGAVATGNPLSEEGLRVALVGGIGGGLTSLRHYLKSVEQDFTVRVVEEVEVKKGKIADG